MAGEFEAITTQEQLDRVLKDRLERKEKAVRGEYADYDDLKAKAEKYDEAQEAAKTELEKATERAAKAEAEAQALREAKARADLAARVSAATGVPATLIQGDTEDAMTASANAIAEYAKAQLPSIPGDKGGAASAHPKALDDSEIGKISDPTARVMAYARGYEGQ